MHCPFLSPPKVRYAYLVSLVPLVRTDGKVFADGDTLTPERMIRDPRLLRSSKTEVTRETERVLGLGDSLYFYAGHACPEFGQIVLVYAPEWSSSEPGGATPFDTGGLRLGYVKGTGTDDPVSYCKHHRVDLTSWTGEFAAYIETSFSSPSAYVLGERAQVDDSTGRLLHPENARRAWTWELQIQADHELLANLKLLCVQSELSEALRRELRALPDDEAAAWIDLLSSPVFRVAPAGAEAPLVCSMAEEVISTWL